MKNIKWLLATIFIALIVYSNTAKADDPVKPVTINDFKTAVIEQGYQLKDHVADQIEATKDYQAEQWAEVKAQWAKIKAKFSSE